MKILKVYRNADEYVVENEMHGVKVKGRRGQINRKHGSLQEVLDFPLGFVLRVLFPESKNY